jgi:hypothetical protein
MDWKTSRKLAEQGWYGDKYLLVCPLPPEKDVSLSEKNIYPPISNNNFIGYVFQITKGGSLVYSGIIKRIIKEIGGKPVKRTKTGVIKKGEKLVEKIKYFREQAEINFNNTPTTFYLNELPPTQISVLLRDALNKKGYERKAALRGIAAKLPIAS